MSLAARLGLLLGLLAIGVLARQIGLLTDRRREWLNAAAFYVALPALVFDATLSRDLASLATGPLVGGFLLVLAAAMGAAWLLASDVEDPSVRAVAVVQSYHGNLGYLGLPLVAAIFGEAGAARAAILLGVGALAQIPVTIAVLVTLTGAATDHREQLGRLLGNPVLISLAAAIVASTLGVTVPEPIRTGIGLLAQAALPLALLVVGAAVEFALPRAWRSTLAGTAAIKLLAMPVAAWFVFGWLGAAPIARQAGVVMLGAPTAVSTVVYATELDGDPRFAAATVSLTTVASVLTLGVVAPAVL